MRGASAAAALVALGVTCTHGFVLPLGRRGLVTVPDSGVMTQAKGQSSPLSTVRPRLSRQASSLVRSSAGGSASSPSKNPPLDKMAVLRYVAATGLQWGAIIAFMGGAEALAKLLKVKQVFFLTFVRLFFAFMSLRSRVFSPLDASRPTVASERVKKLEQKRPGWMPPPKAFPVIWITIGVLRTISSSLIYQHTGTLLATPLLAIMLHLSIGDTWNNINNVERRLGASVPGVITVWLSVCATVSLFYKALPLAGLILLPSAVWITAATALVTHIWYLNGREPLYPFNRQEKDTTVTLGGEGEGGKERDAAAAD